MARDNAEQGLMPSLLDRLIDQDSAGTAWRRGYGVEQLLAAVRRDLEELLNTRQTQGGLADDASELQSSVIAYGLPDLNSIEAHTAQQRADIGRLIESVIARFEPRLRNVKVSIVDNTGSVRTVQFRIEGRVAADPAPEVAFDTILELSTGHYSVKHFEA